MSLHVLVVYANSIMINDCWHQAGSVLLHEQLVTKLLKVGQDSLCPRLTFKTVSLALRDKMASSRSSQHLRVSDCTGF